MTEQPIPLEELKAARLRMKRRVAALIIQALAESGMSYAEVEIRIGEKPGFVKRYINNLIEGRIKGMDPIPDLALGMGFEVRFTAQPLAALSNTEPEPSP